MISAVLEGSPAEWRIARLEDGQLAGLAFIPRDGGVLPGDVYLGRVRRIDKSRDCAFIDLGRGEEALLRLKESTAPIEGAALIVEVARAAQPGKGPRVTRHIDLARIGCDWKSLSAKADGCDAPVLLFRADPFIAAALPLTEGAERIVLDRCPEAKTRFAAAEIWRESISAFEALGIEAAITGLFSTEAPLADGAWLSIEPTAALTAIDVNSGRSRLSHAEINEAAVLEIARQIRLRDLAGRLVVDFIDARDGAATRALATALGAALKEKDRDCRVAGPTTFGLVEIERQWRGRPLTRTARLMGAAALRLAERHPPLPPGRRLKIVAGQAVHDWLNAHSAFLKGVAPAALELAPGLALDQTRIEEI